MRSDPNAPEEGVINQEERKKNIFLDLSNNENIKRYLTYVNGDPDFSQFNITRVEAEKRLQDMNAVPGDFVIRAGSKINTIVLTHKEPSGEIGHALFEYKINTSTGKPIFIDPDGNEITNSINELVTRKNNYLNSKEQKKGYFS